MSDRPPPLRPWARDDIRAQTGAEAADFDRHAIEQVGVPQPVLMENAGRSAAHVLARLFPAGPVVGMVGAGNNGGDALVALRTLAAWGRVVTGVLVADRPEDEPLLHGWSLDIVRDQDLDDRGWIRLWDHGAVVLDGILGTGVRGAPRPRQAEAIQRVNESGLPVLALDVPSGLDAGTGAVPGVAIRAAATVSFGAPKLGALFHPGRALVGRHLSVEIGFPPIGDGDAAATLVTPAWARARLPRRSTDTHKNAEGRVLVAGGGPGMAGAAILAARAAFRAGAGLVRVCTPEENRDAVHAALPEAIHVRPGDVAEALAASDAVVLGPGLGQGDAARDLLRAVVEDGSLPLLLDADALNLAAQGAVDLQDVAARRPVLVTPHPGEMARLLGREPRNPAEDARAAVERYGCTVLLKGAPSVTVDDRTLRVDTQSSSDLAVAGMGDTLSGACGALLARGCEPCDAGALGLYLTGRAAVRAARGPGLTPSDVAEALPDVLVEAVPAVSDLDLPFLTYDADPAR